VAISADSFHPEKSVCLPACLSTYILTCLALPSIPPSLSPAGGVHSRRSCSSCTSRQGTRSR
jgi:hypothetical protein